jgi:signal transduction histidine kinase
MGHRVQAQGRLMSVVRASLAPMRASAPRALAEGLAWFLLFSLLSPVSPVFFIAAYLWLPLWVAWRLAALAPRRWWIAAPLAVGRGLVAGGVLAGGAVLLSHTIARPHMFGFGASSSHDAFSLTTVFLLYLWSRSCVVVVWSTVRYTRRRLRRQLMASHIALVLLLTLTVSGIGSLIGVALALKATDPNATQIAHSVRSVLQESDAVRPFHQRRIQQLLDEMVSDRIFVRGQPPLTQLTSFPKSPYFLAVVRPDGTVIAQASPRSGSQVHHSADNPTFAIEKRTHPHIWHAFLAYAGGGKSMETTVTNPDTGSSLLQPITAEAPILDSSGKLAGLVVVYVGRPIFSSIQVLQGAAAVFGVASALIVMVISIPVIALSFGFSWFVARGLTRNLEALSQIARAIAGGDLSQRAPVAAENEIGDLAGDVNVMAGNLESAMGELREARTQAENSLKARQTLMANISHELRTPLAIMRAHLESLTSRDAVAPGASPSLSTDLPVPRSTVEALHNETERLAALIDDLFSLSRAESGALPILLEQIDVGALIDDVVQVMRPVVHREAAITLSARVSSGLPLVTADRERVRQILTNLIRNAARHTQEGGIIALSALEVGGYVEIQVADTGEGIPPDHLPHVFERFYRADEARTRAAGGAGLGLSIVKEFVEVMGGHVEVESVLGEGTIFHVYLRRAPGDTGSTRTRFAEDTYGE